MKKLLVLLALCMVISVVLVACEDPEQPVVDSSDVTTEAPSEKPTETEPPAGTTDTEPDTGTTDTESDTTPDTSDTTPDTEPVVDPDPVTTHISFDQFCTVLDGTETDVFAPGSSANWDKTANIEDYHVQYIKIWGWAAFYGEAIGEYGYQINDEEPVFSADFATEAEAAVITAAAGKPASRFAIMVPVRDLSGEFTVKGLVRDAAGTVEEICVATVTKAVDPDAPVLVITPDVIATTATGAPDVANVALSEDGSFVTLTNGTVGDPYVTFSNLSVSARYVAVKYRTDIAGSAYNFFAGSVGTGADGNGDMLAGQPYEADGNWHVTVTDLDPADKVNETWDLSFVRYDFYTDGTDRSIDVAYIALFNSAEAAEAYFAKSMIVADNTNTFVSDVDSNEVGTTMDNADLVNFFFTGLPLPGSGVEDLDGAKVYHMTSINELFTNVDGAYFFKANVLSANAAATFFVRGYHVVNSDAIIAAFDPNAGLYKINNYYETDGANAFGGAGIYTSVVNGKLYLLVKYYNADTTTRVGNAVFQVPCEGTELTIADDGYTVSIMVNGVTYATVALSGAQSYADINEVSPAGQFAAKAVVTLKDGTTQTIENTLVAATVNSQVGVASRAGSTKFTSVELGGFSAIEVPALEIVEPEPVDPNAPIAEGTPTYLAGVAMGAGNSQIASAVVSEDGSYVTITTADGNPLDPNFYVLSSGSMVTGVQYIGIKYRTNVAGGGEFFIGSGSNPTGGADELKFDYIADGEWHVLILDVTAHEAVVDGLVNYIRYDIFMNAPAGSSIDVENIVLFNSLEAANNYYGIEEEPEMETIFYDGTNGTTTVPVEGIKYFVRNAAGMKLTIEGAYNFVVTADNLMGQTVVLQSNMFGVIEVDVPADWFSFELIIENVCGEPAEFSMTFTDPNAAADGDGSHEYPYQMTGTEGSITVEFATGFETIFYSYTATANGFIVFDGTDNFSVFVEDAYGSSWLFDGNGYYEVTEGQTYMFFICEAFWSAGSAEGTWAFVTELPGAIPPAWNESPDVVTHQSFDQLYKGDAAATNGPENIFTPGHSATWNMVADLTAGDATILTYWGWIGVKGEVGQFGYMIDEGEMIFNDAWTWATEQGVIDAAKPTGADTASRMKISIDLAGLTGNHYVHVLYKNANGDMVVLGEFVVMLPEASEEPVTNTANVVIADYAAANAWENSVLYSELKVNEDITVAVSATNPSSYGQNTGKYYNSDASWRIYQNENPSITVTAAEGKTIVSVKVTYISNKTGVLLNGDAQIETDAVIEVNANSITLGVGNTSADVSNGQVRITAIEVIYG